MTRRVFSDSYSVPIDTGVETYSSACFLFVSYWAWVLGGWCQGGSCEPGNATIYHKVATRDQCPRTTPALQNQIVTIMWIESPHSPSLDRYPDLGLCPRTCQHARS